ncbi:hypothetical protein HZ326_29136, partial [Fusarium oxysporum f. sp. albedinis]
MRYGCDEAVLAASIATLSKSMSQNAAKSGSQVLDERCSKTQRLQTAASRHGYYRQRTPRAMAGYKVLYLGGCWISLNSGYNPLYLDKHYDQNAGIAVRHLLTRLTHRHPTHPPSPHTRD